MSSNARISELHVEVPLNEHCHDIFGYVPKHKIEAAVADWLHMTHAGFFVDTHVDVPVDAGLPYADHIRSIRIVDYVGPYNQESVEGSSFHEIDKSCLKVHAYELHPPPSSIPISNTVEDPQIHGLRLPNQLLATTWENLLFESINPKQLLRSISRIITLIKQPNLDLNALNLNRLILFHGPPGCGKTTLCRALAQKLTIRLGSHFKMGHLIELNTQSMLSKYYSESGRLVTQHFQNITRLAVEKPDNLFFLLIDEVESIAGSREQQSDSGECHDSIRATNQLLTALDRVRTTPNVLVMCTSNLKSVLDNAFVDRVDYEIAVPAPCESAIYEILRSTLNGLVKCGLITPSPCPFPEAILPDAEERNLIPDHKKLLMFNEYPDCAACKVMHLAKRCKGFSGRTLRKLPLLAISMHTWGDSCPMDDALVALDKAVGLSIGVGSDLYDRQDTAMVS